MTSSLVSGLAAHEAPAPATIEELSTLRDVPCRGARPAPPPRGPATIATLHRTIAAVDAQTLDDLVCGWIRDQTRPARRVIAVDGKEVHGAKHGHGQRVFLLAAFDHATGCVLAQELVGDKTNEIPPQP